MVSFAGVRGSAYQAPSGGLGGTRSSSAGGASGGSSGGGSSSGISKADINDLLKSFQSTTQGTSAARTVTQAAPQVSTSTAPDPRLSQMFGEFSSERRSLAGNIDENARLAMARGQEATDRAGQQATIGAAQRGFTPESGVSRLLGAKAQMQGLQSQQGLSADLANQGRMLSANMLGQQAGVASGIASQQLAAQQAAAQNTYNAQSLAAQMAQQELAARQAAAQQQYQLTALIGSLFTG